MRANSVLRRGTFGGNGVELVRQNILPGVVTSFVIRCSPAENIVFPDCLCHFPRVFEPLIPAIRQCCTAGILLPHRPYHRRSFRFNLPQGLYRRWRFTIQRFKVWSGSWRKLFLRDRSTYCWKISRNEGNSVGFIKMSKFKTEISTLSSAYNWECCSFSTERNQSTTVISLSSSLSIFIARSRSSCYREGIEITLIWGLVGGRGKTQIHAPNVSGDEFILLTLKVSK